MLNDSCVDALVSVLFLSAVKPDYSASRPPWTAYRRNYCTDENKNDIKSKIQIMEAEKRIINRWSNMLQIV